ncbi:DUF998 domain-containing protein [uncultured Corynebacterium sp.]|uniref:DUF998 domain-containing protein n=1 Tax=uncultured Corynebacterium sp. TaxID=159447 RepID=UPI00338E94FD
MNPFPLEQPKVAPHRQVRFARGGLVAALGSVVLAVIAHAANPELAPSWAPISDLALGPRGGWMTGAFILWSAAGACAAITIRPFARTKAARFGVALLVVSAFGPALAGGFPADPYTTPLDAQSPTGGVHAVGAMLSDLLPLAMIILTVVLAGRQGPWREYRLVLVASTLLLLGALVWVSVAMGLHFSMPGATLGPEAPLGWPNRAHVLACLGSYAALCWIPIACSSKSHRRVTP